MGERKLIKTFGFVGGKVLESSFNSGAEHSSESKFKTENRYRTSIGWTLGKRLRFQYFLLKLKTAIFASATKSNQEFWCNSAMPIFKKFILAQITTLANQIAVPLQQFILDKFVA